MCAVNPIDHMVTSGAVPVRPLLHIPGCEISGTIEGIGKHVKDDLHEGDMVIVHSKVFDSIGYYCKIDISYKLQADYTLRHHFFDSCFYTVSDMKLFNTL
jgi:D-arabinose 1-dehydrogenase-like Zn-dependent alcohol dehydrogenase